MSTYIIITSSDSLVTETARTTTPVAKGWSADVAQLAAPRHYPWTTHSHYSAIIRTHSPSTVSDQLSLRPRVIAQSADRHTAPPQLPTPRVRAGAAPTLNPRRVNPRQPIIALPLVSCFVWLYTANILPAVGPYQRSGLFYRLLAYDWDFQRFLWFRICVTINNADAYISFTSPFTFASLGGKRCLRVYVTLYVYSTQFK